MIGKQLGSWILDRELGKGGMGTVYLAHHVDSSPESPQRAAIKVLAIEHTLEDSTRERFQREIQVLRRLKHPNIVALLDAGTAEGRHYYAMEYVDGPSFQMLLNQQGRLPWEEVLDMALQVCQALKHAHHHGIIHRDLKPSNLLRGPSIGASTPYGLVKLTDFGIAWVFAEPHLTAPGTVVGTAEYLSPEQAAGKQPSKRSDIYSLGTVLYALLTGRPPFEGEMIDLLHKHRYAQFDKPSRIAVDIPYDLEEVVCQMLAKEPDQRPPDAGVLYRRLDVLRRKYQRKAAERTSHDQSARDTAIEHADAPESGPATIMAELMREELHRQNLGGPVYRFFHHPIMLLLLFAATLGIIVWTFWPVSQEELYQQAERLMASTNTADWQEAEALFDKLDQKYPDHPYQKEVRELRQKIEKDREERRQRASISKAPPMSEAQWFYEKALRLRQQGKPEEAKAIWKNLIAAFHDVPDESVWVSLAQEELKQPSGRERTGANRWAPVHRALERIKELKKENKIDEAEQIRKALLALYENDPSARKILED